MARRGNNNAEQQRRRLVLECARVMAEDGVRDFHLAKQKAAARLGLRRVALPTNREIEVALAAHLGTFSGEDHPARLQQHALLAAEVLVLLGDFGARVAGSLSRGVITAQAPLEVHLFSDGPEEVEVFLRERDIPCRYDEKRLRFGGGRERRLPVLRYAMEGVAVELVIFPTTVREAPRSPVDGQPVRRLALADIRSGH
ncbi:MAG: hypothetical protein LJE84_09150 [Gammaproteobacteria bacterium]|nr:hypothetical protein [Gammaproteobacteria bacterium]